MSLRGRPSVCVSVLTSSSYKDPSHNGSGPTHRTPLYLIYLFNGPISKYSHILQWSELEPHHMDLGESRGAQLSPQQSKERKL